MQQCVLSDITFDMWLFSYCQVSDSCGHQPELLQAHTETHTATQTTHHTRHTRTHTRCTNKTML